MNHLGTRELETNRLKLRRFQLSDSEAMFRNWASDTEVTKYLTWPSHKDVSVSESVLKEWITQYKKDKFYQLAIVLKSNGNEPIGSIFNLLLF
jgi:[ribosomal protein S5]-alanine N-acetyltransferase